MNNQIVGVEGTDAADYGGGKVLQPTGTGVAAAVDLVEDDL
jgi:hypothetical protein